jgi:hypothetical protein
MENKKSALEWLEEEMINNGLSIPSNLLKQAKKIEKEELSEAISRKQTAVDLLVDKVNSDEYQNAFGKTYISIAFVEYARKIFKQQIMDARKDGFLRTYLDKDLNHYSKQTDEEYYKRTYGN